MIRILASGKDNLNDLCIRYWREQGSKIIHRSEQLRFPSGLDLWCIFFSLTFHSRYLIYPLEALAYQRSESKEWIFPKVLLLSILCPYHPSNTISIMFLVVSILAYMLVALIWKCVSLFSHTGRGWYWVQPFTFSMTVTS